MQVLRDNGPSELNLDGVSLEELTRLVEHLGTTISTNVLVGKARDELLSYAKLVYPEYQTPSHIRLLAQKLEAVERGEIRRLIINMPPRHGKTQLASEVFPAWFLGRNPAQYIIAATYAQELANDYGRKVRNQFLDPLFQEVFPGVILSEDSQSAIRFALRQRGVYFSVGVGGPITGRGAHLLIIDDPVKGREEADSAIQRAALIAWYRSVARTRLMPGGRIIIINTRWHEEDLAGWVQKHTPHEGWEVLSLPAQAEDNDILGRKRGEWLWPEAFSAKEYEDLKRTNAREWNALYQQRPTAEEGNIFKRENWRIWRQRHPATGRIMPPECEYVIQSYDTAYSEKTAADPTAVTTWGVFRDEDDVPNVILLSALNERWEYPRLRKEVVELYKKFLPDTCIIETKMSGLSLMQDMRRAGVPVVGYNPGKGDDKVNRANSILALFEQGRVWVPEGKQWADELMEQAAAFPNGRHDDLVDSMTMALKRLKDGYFLTLIEDRQAEEDQDDRLRRRAYW